MLSVLDKVVSEEPDVKGVVAKVALGQADAGFVYATDARVVVAAADDPIPASGCAARFEIAVLRSSLPEGRARAWVKRVTDGTRARRLLRQGRLRAAGERVARVQRLVGALTAVLPFLTLPIVAIFAEIPPGRLLDGLRSDVARDALAVTPWTNLIANAVIPLVGTPAAYLLVTRRFRGHALLLTLVELLPLVLPPAVAGIGLIAAFGSLGLVGEHVEAAQVSVGTQAAVVMAVVYGGPLLRPAGRRGLRRRRPLPARRRTHARRGTGARPRDRRGAAGCVGLGAGAALAFARGLGEFGATIMFAGSLRGVTQTLSLAVYDQLDADFDIALAIGALLVAEAGALLLAVKVVPGWARFASTSTVRSDPSASG